MKIRIKFTKTGTMRFIGHLDLMRYFQKLMRRARVDIRYSEGFSPHQIMSFATAMGLGMTSEGEYVDIDVLSTGSSEEMIRRLNAASTEEIQILRYCQIPDETKSAMAQIAAADYVVSIPKECIKIPGEDECALTATDHEISSAKDEDILIVSDHEMSPETADAVPSVTARKISPGSHDFYKWLSEKISEFCAQESVVLLKKTKKSEQEVDIRPMIYQFCPIVEDESTIPFSRIKDGPSADDSKKYSAASDHVSLSTVSICPDFVREVAPASDYFRVFLRLATGSEQNLKPELVMEAFFRFLGFTAPEETALKIHRTEIYGRRADAQEKLQPLSDYGWDIENA